MNSLQNILRAGSILVVGLFLANGQVTIAQTSSITQDPSTELSNRFALTASAGLNGFGGELVWGIGEKLNSRIGFHGGAVGLDGEFDNQEPTIGFNGDISLSSLSLILDYYPFGKVVGFSLGAYSHTQTFSLDGEALENYVIDDRAFTPGELGTMSATLEYASSIKPYVGLVLGHPTRLNGRVKAHVQIGAMYSGAPTLNLEATGMIAPTADNEANLNDALQDFPWTPVLNLGVSVRIRD